MDALARDLRYAVRALRQMRGAAIVSILTLALGIGATTTMFSVVHAALLRPPAYEDPDRLVILFNTSVTPRDGLQRLRWSLPNITALERTAQSFDGVGSFTGPLLTISGRGEPEHVQAETVSPGYFQALRVRPAAGRLFTDEEGTGGAAPVVLIGTQLWQRMLGGNGSALGATLSVNDVPLTVIGILPEGFSGLSGKAEVWIAPPIGARLYYAEYMTTPQNFISAVARLKDGVTLAQANAELAAIGPRFVGNSADPRVEWSATAVPLREARVDPIVRQSALILLAAAVCVLLIACVNVAGLLLARARVRRREIAVRLAIGSGRARLVRQLLTEGMVMAVSAGAAGTLLAWWGVRLFARAAPAVIANGRNNYAAIGALAEPRLNPQVLLFALACALGTTMIFALVPAVLSSRADLATALKEDDRGGGRRGRSLAVLVVSEVALACVLLTASGVLTAQFARLQNRRTGFVAEDVLTFWVRPPGSRYPPAAGPATLDRLLTRIAAVPGVEAAAVNRCVPFTGCSNTTLFLPDRDIDRANAPGVGRHYISPDYFRTLGIPLLAGRALSFADRAGSPPVAIVNASGARRFWPGESAIGKRVWFGTTTGPFSDPAHAVEIVGVAGDVKYGGVDQMDQPDRADFYTSYLQFAYPDTMVIVKSRGAAASLLPAMRAAVASVDPSLPVYDPMTLDERVSLAVARPRFNAALLGAFAAAALLLAAIGVYGVLSYSVSSRLREIGVRLALGADAARVMRLVLGEGVRLAAIGAAIGIVLSLAAARLARGLVDQAAWDPRLLAIAGGVMLATAALAAIVPARRAGAVDPIVALRND